MCGAFTFTQGFVGIKNDHATPEVADQEFDNGTMKLNLKKKKTYIHVFSVF